MERGLEREGVAGLRGECACGGHFTEKDAAALARTIVEVPFEGERLGDVGLGVSQRHRAHPQTPPRKLANTLPRYANTPRKHLHPKHLHPKHPPKGGGPLPQHERHPPGPQGGGGGGG